MNDKREQKMESFLFLQPTPDLRRLCLLEEINKKAGISQSELAKRVGLAASMVNNYLKQLIADKLMETHGDNQRDDISSYRFGQEREGTSIKFIYK